MRTSKIHSTSVLSWSTAAMHLGSFGETAQRPSSVSCGVIGRGEERAFRLKPTLRRDSTEWPISIISSRNSSVAQEARRKVIRGSLLQDICHSTRGTGASCTLTRTL